MPCPHSQPFLLACPGVGRSGSFPVAVARLPNLVESAVIDCSERQDATDDYAPKKLDGNRRALLLSERDWLLARASAPSDQAVCAVRTELAERATRVSRRYRVALSQGGGAHLQKERASRRAGLVADAGLCGGGLTKP